MELFIYLFAALFSVLNPIGTVPIFVALTEGYTSAERAKVSLITSINVLIILLISFFIGQYVLSFFGITITALRIAGGIIITSSGFGLLNGNRTWRNIELIITWFMFIAVPVIGIRLFFQKQTEMIFKFFGQKIMLPTTDVVIVFGIIILTYNIWKYIVLTKKDVLHYFGIK